MFSLVLLKLYLKIHCGFITCTAQTYISFMHALYLMTIWALCSEELYTSVLVSSHVKPKSLSKATCTVCSCTSAFCEYEIQLEA